MRLEVTEKSIGANPILKIVRIYGRQRMQGHANDPIGPPRRIRAGPGKEL